jgi:hypothetical protein
MSEHGVVAVTEQKFVAPHPTALAPRQNHNGNIPNFQVNQTTQTIISPQNPPQTANRHLGQEKIFIFFYVSKKNKQFFLAIKLYPKL